MKHYRLIERSILAFVALASVLASAPALAIDVALAVDAVNNELIIADNTDKCEVIIEPKKCIKIGKGQKPFINFNLPHACDNSSEDPQYKLNGMWLSMIGYDGPPASSKGFGKYNLPQPVYDDFNADGTTGQVNFTPPNSIAGDRIRVQNRNQAEYVVFFKIEAIPCPGKSGPSIWLDPRFENTGN